MFDIGYLAGWLPPILVLLVPSCNAVGSDWLGGALPAVQGLVPVNKIKHTFA